MSIYLAIQIGLDDRQLRNYKKLTDLIPELQQIIENGYRKDHNTINDVY
ncbi:hypothetical protein [Clostridium puniceum]|nr:hypothetical protein [Clostridium puniceum]